MPTPAPAVPLTAPVTIFNARITDMAPTVVSEQIGTQIQFTYNPITGQGAFAFLSRPYMYINGQPQPVAGTTTNSLQVAAEGAILAEMLAPGLADPVTGADLSQVSVAGVMLYIKNAFDILYNRRAASQAVPNPDQPYPSVLAIAQSNALYDLFGNGIGGYPLGRSFGGFGTTDGAPSPTPVPTPPNPFA